MSTMTRMCASFGMCLAIFSGGVLQSAEDVEALNEQLLTAVGEGDTEAIERLLGLEADINAKDDGGWTSLHKAARGGHLDVVEALLEKGAKR